MKRIILLLLLFIAIAAKGQTLVDANNTCSIVEGSFWFDPNYSTETYRFFEDTLINGKTYKKLYGSIDSSLTKWKFNGNPLREDSSKKVEIAQDSPEPLLY